MRSLAILCAAVLLGFGGAGARLAAEPQKTPNQEAKKKGPQAKSKQEYEAFLAAANAPSAALAETSAKDFEAKFPKSELLSTVFEQVMAKYQESGDIDKSIEMGRKALQYDPENAIALVMTSSLLADNTRGTDIDRDEKLKEASDDANRALRALDSGNFYLGANATSEQIAAFKDMITYMATASLGQSELLRDHFAAAAQQLQQSVATQKGSADATNWLRLSQAEEGQKRYSDALIAANKAAALAPANSPVANAATAAQARLKQLASK